MTQGVAVKPVPERAGTRFHLLCGVLLAVLSVLVYARVAGYGYAVTDDHFYITNNVWVRQGLTWEGVLWAFQSLYFLNWHPLTWLSLMADTSLFGGDPRPRHLVSLAFHVVNAWLVYAIAVRLLRRPLPALFAAALFAVHPLHAQSVVWLSERKDVLCGFFYFSAILLYLRYVACPGWGRYLLVVLATACALMAKPMAVSLPVVFLLLDATVLQRLDRATFRLLIQPRQYLRSGLLVFTEKVPLGLLVIGSMAVTLVAQGTAMIPTGELPFPDRLMNAIVSYVVYLRDILVPTRLAVFYPYVKLDFLAVVLPCLLLLLVLVTALVTIGRRAPLVQLGFSWYFLTLIPVIGLVQVGDQSHADRYTYIPAVGIYLVMGWLLARAVERWREATLLSAGSLVIFYAWLGWVQVGYWATPELLWKRAVELYGPSRSADVSLFEAYFRAGDFDRAQVHAESLLSHLPNDFAGYSAMGAIATRREQYAIAESWYRRALRLNPGDARMLNNLGYALKKQGKRKAARQAFLAAMNADANLSVSNRNLVDTASNRKQEARDGQ